MSTTQLLNNPVVATTSKTTTTTPIAAAATATATTTPLSSYDLKAAGKGEESHHFPLATYEQVVQNADVFMETLKDLHGSLRTKFMIPTLGGRSLDLHTLFVEVTARGGLEQVIRNRQWREIIAVFNFPTTITNASFVLRKYYISLLHHYEQVYFFRTTSRPVPMTSMVNSPVSGSSALQIQCAISPTPENGTSANELPDNSQTWHDHWVTGTIDGKFDNGYLVTVSFGSEKLKGVLYHVPLDVPMSRNSDSPLTPRRRKKRSRLEAMDPARPKPNRSGYNYFFSEHYASLLTANVNGQEKTISTKIGNLWSELTEAEKQVYRDKGLRDKERYRREMIEYRKSANGSKSQGKSANGSES